MPGETEGLPKTPLFSIRYCLPRAGVDRSDSIDSVRNRDLALVFHLVVLFTAAVFRAEVRVEVSGIGIGFDFAFCVWLWLTCPPRPSLAFIIAWGARVPGSGTGQFPVWAIRPGTPPNKQFATQQRENAETVFALSLRSGHIALHSEQVNARSRIALRNEPNRCPCPRCKLQRPNSFEIPRVSDPIHARTDEFCRCAQAPSQGNAVRLAPVQNQIALSVRRRQ